MEILTVSIFSIPKRQNELDLGVNDSIDRWRDIEYSPEANLLLHLGNNQYRLGDRGLCEWALFSGILVFGLFRTIDLWNNRMEKKIMESDKDILFIGLLILALAFIGMVMG